MALARPILSKTPKVVGNPARRLTTDLTRVEPTRDNVPEVPSALAAACATRKCALFTGGGIAAQGGLPTFKSVLEGIIELAADSHSGRPWEMVRSYLDGGDVITVADILAAWLDRKDLLRLMRSVYVRKPGAPTRIYQLIGQVEEFAGILNWSWDDRLAVEFADRLARGARGRPRLGGLLTSSDSEEFGLLARSQSFFLVNVNGQLDRPDTFIFTPEDYRSKVATNDWFSKFVNDCFANWTLLFVGTSYESIEEFVSGLNVRIASDGKGLTHFALMPRGPDFEIRKELFWLKYGIELLGFTATDDYPEVIEFLTHCATTRRRRGNGPRSVRHGRPGWSK